MMGDEMRKEQNRIEDERQRNKEKNDTMQTVAIWIFILFVASGFVRGCIHGGESPDATYPGYDWIDTF